MMQDGGYLFVTFTDGREDGEQIYFALSRDGLHWKDLNGGNPVLCSHIGERGVRDPFILRACHGGSSGDREHFYLIATDLRIANGKGWEAAVHKGSRSVILWESDDLVHWTKERSIEIGVPEAGCVWAPEAVYDEKRGCYLMFFASCVKLPGDKEPKHRIYASSTKDFREFSEPQIYIEREHDVIDTTIVKEGDLYYRISKDEKTKSIYIDCGEDLMGDFAEVRSEVLRNLTGVEGPAAFFRKEQGMWCLLVDQFAAQKGYLPLLTRNLAGGEFFVMEPGSYDMGAIKKRHGSVLTLTAGEYERLEAFADSIRF